MKITKKILDIKLV